jgi:hypothetical protein
MGNPDEKLLADVKGKLITKDVITFVFETFEDPFRVTITGDDMNEAVEIDDKRFTSVYDQICESKRISVLSIRHTDAFSGDLRRFRGGAIIPSVDERTPG